MTKAEESYTSALPDPVGLKDNRLQKHLGCPYSPLFLPLNTILGFQNSRKPLLSVISRLDFSPLIALIIFKKLFLKMPDLTNAIGKLIGMTHE